MSSDVTKVFADNLSDLIAERKVSTRELSTATGIANGSLSNYSNDNAEAGISNAAMLAKYFGVSLDWLTGLEKECRNPNMDFRGACEFVGLSENAVAFLHKFKDRDFLAVLSNLIENSTFTVLLAQMSKAVKIKLENRAYLSSLGIDWKADDIISKLDDENVDKINYMLFSPNNKEHDEFYLNYELNQTFSELVEELFRPFSRDEYNRIYAAVNAKLYKKYENSKPMKCQQGGIGGNNAE